jgi:hypothetical protein
MKTSDSKILLLPMMLFLAFSSLSEANPARYSAPSAKPFSYSFIQSAQKAIFKKNTDTSYTLVLKRIAPYVTYFSDKPNRKTNAMSLAKFMTLFETKNSNNPLNADLHGTKFSFFSNNHQYNFVFELSNPQYDETFKTLSYTAKLLQGSTVPTKDSDIMYDVTLFIDNILLKNAL